MKAYKLGYSQNSAAGRANEGSASHVHVGDSFLAAIEALSVGSRRHDVAEALEDLAVAAVYLWLHHFNANTDFASRFH